MGSNSLSKILIGLKLLFAGTGLVGSKLPARIILFGERRSLSMRISKRLGVPFLDLGRFRLAGGGVACWLVRGRAGMVDVCEVGWLGSDVFLI